MEVTGAGSCRPIDVFNPAMEINCPEVQFQNRVISTDPSGNSWSYENENSNTKCGHALWTVQGVIRVLFHLPPLRYSGRWLSRTVLWTSESDFSTPPPTKHTLRYIIYLSLNTFLEKLLQWLWIYLLKAIRMKERKHLWMWHFSEWWPFRKTF